MACTRRPRQQLTLQLEPEDDVEPVSGPRRRRRGSGSGARLTALDERSLRRCLERAGKRPGAAGNPRQKAGTSSERFSTSRLWDSVDWRARGSPPPSCVLRTNGRMSNSYTPWPNSCLCPEEATWDVPPPPRRCASSNRISPPAPGVRRERVRRLVERQELGPSPNASRPCRPPLVFCACNGETGPFQFLDYFVGDDAQRSTSATSSPFNRPKTPSTFSVLSPSRIRRAARRTARQRPGKHAILRDVLGQLPLEIRGRGKGVGDFFASVLHAPDCAGCRSPGPFLLLASVSRSPTGSFRALRSALAAGDPERAAPSAYSWRGIHCPAHSSPPKLTPLFVLT